jgi:3-phosphoshikimate 1-carboxyvinyltransferase
VSFVVEPSAIESGVITVPGDKSISHRALMLGAAANGTTSISGFLAGEDCLATAEALRLMGVTIEQPKDTEVLIHGSGLADWTKPDGPIDLGNSGTAIRLFAGLLSGLPFPTELAGDESLMSRPMNRVIRPLTLMGAEITSDGGMPPLQIKGGRDLAGIDYRLPVASAQVKSAILLAGLRAEGDITIEEPAVTRDHTERMLRSMGAVVTQGGTQIQMRGGQSLNGVQVDVPADLSSAAFLILAATIGKAVTLEIPGVGINPTRTGMIDILQAMGADISLNNVRLQGEEPVADLIVRSAPLTGIDVDPARVSLAIDEFPVLFIAAACAEGRTRFSGIGELRVKESDRIFAMADGLRALGISVDESEDGAVVQGGRIRGGHVASHGDHRIAMSFAIAGTVADLPVTVSDTSNVDTSFPGFVGCLQSLGVPITRVEEKRE